MKRLEQIKFNMRLSLIIKTFLLLTLFSTNAFSQGAPNIQGKEFWLSFGTRNFPAASLSGLDNTFVYQVRVVASKATNVTFSYTANSSFNKTYSVAAGQVFTHDFTAAEVLLLYNEVINGTQTSNRSLRITSNENISVYAIDLYRITTDATNLLPVSNYGTEYYTLSHIPADLVGLDGYIIIANEDGTQIRENGTLRTTLNRGQVYLAHGTIDFTGRRITSNKPFAMFTTNTANAAGGGTADCLYQQLVPISSWGSTFFVPVTNPSNALFRNRDRIRIIASQDGTIISQTGGTVVTNTGGVSNLSSPLNAGRFVELDIRLEDKGCYITADKPIAVASYLIGGAVFMPDQLQRVGDPSMAWIAPIEQMVTTATLAPFFAEGSSILRDNQHYALIVTPTATKNNTRIAIGTGAYLPLSGGTWVDNTVAGYSYYSYNFSATDRNSAYYIENPAGFTALAYGLGTDESYFYLAAAAARQLSAAFYINDVHFQDADGTSICGNSLALKAEINFQPSATPGYLRWYLNGTEQVAMRDRLEWTTSSLSVGSHTVRMVVVSDGGETVESTSTITITGAMSPGTISGSQSIASGATPTAFTSTPATGGVGTITYQWQSSANGTSWSNISGATSANYAPGALTTTTYYRRRATSTCGTVETTSIQVTVAGIGADIITAANREICSGEVASLSASASSITSPVFRWYNAATGGSLLRTGATYSPSPTSTTTYYVSVSSGASGTESSRKAVTVTVKPTATPDMIKITQ